MINRTQKAIMSAIYKRAADKGGTCLIRPVELLSAIPYSVRFKRDDLPAYLKSLQTDDYFELIETDKKGDLHYCFTLHQNDSAHRCGRVAQLCDRAYSAQYFLIKKLICANICAII